MTGRQHDHDTMTASEPYQAAIHESKQGCSRELARCMAEHVGHCLGPARMLGVGYETWLDPLPRCRDRGTGRQAAAACLLPLLPDRRTNGPTLGTGCRGSARGRFEVSSGSPACRAGERLDKAVAAGAQRQ